MFVQYVGGALTFIALFHYYNRKHFESILHQVSHCIGKPSNGDYSPLSEAGPQFVGEYVLALF